MASKQTMNMNRHLRSSSGTPEPLSRRKREAKRENARKVAKTNGSTDS